MRRAGRTDANQKEIVDALRKAGASVHVTSSLGGGFPDLVVGYRFETYLLEVKPRAAPTVKELTEEEKTFFAGWRGHIALVGSVNEALQVIGAI